MARRSVAYVLKGYPRLSEIFIASEIYRVEQEGVPVRLYVLKPRDQEDHHPVIERIAAQPTYLSDATSLREQPFVPWLRQNLPSFASPLRRTFRRRPIGFIRAAAAAAVQSVRARRTRRSAPRKLYAKEFLRATALADAVLDERDVRHLHAHFAHGTTTVTWLAAMITGLPFSFTGHAKDVWSPALNPAGLLRRKLLAAEFTISCTEANRNHLQSLAPEATVHRIYHGLNADFAALVANANGHFTRPRHKLGILAVGRLVPKKGFDILLEACALLVRERSDLDLQLIGEDGEHGAELRELVGRLGLSRHVRFRGALGQAELFDAYREATMLCAPSRILSDGDRDGIPNVIAEAMACGTPVVATPVSGIPELVENGVNGLFVQPDDPAALADAIAAIDRDPMLARRLGEGGRATIAERFDGERLTQDVAELFRRSLWR